MSEKKPTNIKNAIGWIVKFTDNYKNNLSNRNIINDESELNAIKTDKLYVYPPTVVSSTQSKINVEYYAFKSDGNYYPTQIELDNNSNDITWVKQKVELPNPPTIDETFGWLVKLPNIENVQYSSNTIYGGHPIVIGHLNNNIVVNYKSINDTGFDEYKFKTFNFDDLGDNIEWITKIQKDEQNPKNKDTTIIEEIVKNFEKWKTNNKNDIAISNVSNTNTNYNNKNTSSDRENNLKNKTTDSSKFDNNLLSPESGELHPPSDIKDSMGWIILRIRVGDVEEDNHATLMKVMDFSYYNNTIKVQSISPTGEPTGELIELDFDTDKIIWRNPPEKEQSENQLEEATTTPTAVNSLEKQPPGGVVADKCRNCTTDTFKDSFYIYPKDLEATFSISMGAINNAGLMERESYEYKMALATNSETKNELAKTNLTYNFIYFDKVYDPLYQFLDIWKFQMNRQLNPAVYFSGSKRNLNYLVEKFHTIMFQNEKAKEMYKSQLGGLVKLIAANPALYFFSATKIEKLASEVAAKGAEKVAEEEKEELTEELNLENLVEDERNDNTDFNDGSDSSNKLNSKMLGVVPGNGGNKKKRGGFFGVENFHIAEGLRNTLKKVSVKNAVKSIRKTAKNVIGTPFLKTRMYRKLQKFYHFKYDFASTAKDMMASVGNSIGKIFNKEFFTDKYPFFMKREIIYSLLVAYQTFSFLQNKMEKRAEVNSAEMKKKFSDLLVATKTDEEEVVEEEVEVELDDKTQTPINKSQEETPAKNGEKKTGTWYSIFNKKKAEMNEEEEDIPPAKIEKETTPVLLPNNEKKREELNDEGKKEKQVKKKE